MLCCANGRCQAKQRDAFWLRSPVCQSKSDRMRALLDSTTLRNLFEIRFHFVRFDGARTFLSALSPLPMGMLSRHPLDSILLSGGGKFVVVASLGFAGRKLRRLLSTVTPLRRRSLRSDQFLESEELVSCSLPVLRFPFAKTSSQISSRTSFFDERRVDGHPAANPNSSLNSSALTGNPTGKLHCSAMLAASGNCPGAGGAGAGGSGCQSQVDASSRASRRASSKSRRSIMPLSSGLRRADWCDRILLSLA